MALSDEQYNKALEIFQEFGSRRRIPIFQRWGEVFPEVEADEMHNWESLFKNLQAFAYGLAEKVRDNRLDEHDAIRQIAESYPRLSSNRVLATYNQARYFAMM